MSYSLHLDMNEIYSNIEKLEESILKIESDFMQNGFDVTDIHTAFRYAHNLKSLVAVSGREDASKLIHAIETGLDRLRKDENAASYDLFHLCLNALDLTKYDLNGGSMQSGRSEELIGEIYRELETVKNSNVGWAGNIPMDKDLDVKIKSLAAKGSRIFQLTKLIKPSIDRQSFETLPVFRDIEEAGTLIAYSPKFEELSPDKDEALLNIIFASCFSMDELEYIIFDPLREISLGAEETASTEGAMTAEGCSLEKSLFKSLILVQDFFKRKQLVKMLSKYGDCDTAASSSELIPAIIDSVLKEDNYKLLVLDMECDQNIRSVIMEIRTIEENANFLGSSGSKILVLTGTDIQKESVVDLYSCHCDMHIDGQVKQNELSGAIEKLLNRY